jgi:hypothetical protein
MKSIFVVTTKFINETVTTLQGLFFEALEMADYDLQWQAVVNMVMNFRVR